MSKNKKPSIRRIAEVLAAGGRPNPAGRAYPELYRTLLAVGLNPSQAMAVTCTAYDASEYTGSTEMITRNMHALRMASRERHAVENPRGIWATLRDAYGREAFYFSDEDERVRNWSNEATVTKAYITQVLRDCRTY